MDAGATQWVLPTSCVESVGAGCRNDTTPGDTISGVVVSVFIGSNRVYGGRGGSGCYASDGAPCTVIKSWCTALAAAAYWDSGAEAKLSHNLPWSTELYIMKIRYIFVAFVNKSHQNNYWPSKKKKIAHQNMEIGALQGNLFVPSWPSRVLSDCTSISLHGAVNL